MVQVIARESPLARVAAVPRTASTNRLPADAALKSAADETVCEPVAVKVFDSVKDAAPLSDDGAV
jgi:hypothetical protein